MNMTTKKLLAVLLSAIMVMSSAFVSTAETQKYEKPELNREDTIETTGKWKKDKKGVWRLETENGRATDGWYYANKIDSPTEFGWYHFDEKGNMSTGWIIDKKDSGVWYYAGETKDGEEGSLVTGWVTDPQDGKKYYLDPATGVMSYGWKKIGSKMYYFGEKKYADVPWTKDAKGHWTAGKGKHSFGTMYANEVTPDGYWVGPNGALKVSDDVGGSSGGGSYVVFGADASTSTAQYAGTRFDTTGLKLTVYKNGALYKTVDAQDRSVKILKILVKGEDKVLVPGTNDIEISFLFKDGHLLTGQTVTTRVVGEYGLNNIHEGGSIYLVDENVPKGKYKFYNKDGYELKEWEKSEDIVKYLASATNYVEMGDESEDYIYMYDSTGGAQDITNNYFWTFYDAGGIFGWMEEFINGEGPLPKEIGSGKANTAAVLGKRLGAYIREETGETIKKPTVWYWIHNLNNPSPATPPLGYDDWFIPSYDELMPLNAKIQSVIPSKDLWSSSEAEKGTVYYNADPNCSVSKHPEPPDMFVIAVRSF